MHAWSRLVRGRVACRVRLVRGQVEGGPPHAFDTVGADRGALRLWRPTPLWTFQ